MSFWTDLRDTVESGAVLAGNYLLPGSGLVTKNLVSEGSQKQLGSSLGQLAMLGTGGAGAAEGNLANYGTAYDKVSGLVGGGGTSGITGQQAVDAFNAGKISAAEFEALASGAGVTGKDLLAGAGLSKYLTPAAILASGAFGAQAAQKAATTQAEAQSQANQLAYAMFKEQQALQEPWRQAGQNALAKMQGTDYALPAAFTGKVELGQDPGYAFRLSEGQKALERSAAARGGLLSGATGKALTRFGQEMGSQEYQNAYNRALDAYNAQVARSNTGYNRLASMAGLGQTATGQLSQAAGTYGQQAGAGLTDVARAQAGGYMGAANALTGALNTGLNYMSNQDLINSLTRRSSYGTA